MTTRARYELLPSRERGSIETGESFETGRRTDWTFLLNLSRLDAGGAVTVVLEASPLDTDAEFAEIFSFGSLTSVASVLKRQRTEGESFAGPLASDLLLRARVTAATGNSVLEVLAWAPFFSLEDDLDLLPQEVRDWEDGLTRTVEASEDMLLRTVLRKGGGGRLKANLSDPRFPDAMRDAIALQSEHTYRKGRLLESRDPSSQVTARQLPGVSSEARRILDEFLLRGATVWRGR